MKSNIEATSKKTIICREKIEKSTDKNEAIHVEYDLSPLNKIINFSGMETIVSTLRDIHHSYAQLVIIEAIWGENDIETNVPDHLFHLKTLADIFDEIYSGDFELKENRSKVLSEVI